MKAIVVIVILLLVGIGGWYVFNTNSINKNITQTTEQRDLDQQKQTDASTKTLYTSNLYKFSLNHPTGGFVLEKSFDAQCTVLGADNVGRGENIHLEKGTFIPLTFASYPVNSLSKEQVFVGSVGYKLASNCILNPAITLFVIKKGADFNLETYLDNSVKSAQEGVSGGATGGTASKTSVTVNGRNVPVIRVQDGSVMQNRTDTYYFEGTQYLYELSYNYSQAVISDDLPAPEKESFEGQVRDYAIAKEIIDNFSY